MKRWIVIVAIILGILGITGFFVYDYFIHLNDPMVSEAADTEIFEVSSGSSFKAVVDKLEANGYIRSATYSQYLYKTKGPFEIKAGEFEISKSMTTQAILEHLSSNKNAIQKVYTFQLIPGFRQKDYAKEIASKGYLSEEAILNAWNSEEFLQPLIDKYEVLTEDILSDNLFSKLEGYLFPDTYEVKQDATILQVTTKVLDHLEKYYKSNKDKFEATGRTTHEVFSLASIVQAEASTSEDMFKVGSVINNRLKSKMRLGMSVTVCYAKQIFNNWQECEKTSFDSPYNTYQHAGIPIGPIGNPSIAALEAMISPIETSYLYFIADVYGDNTMYFANTLKEHQANIDKYLRRP